MSHIWKDTVSFSISILHWVTKVLVPARCPVSQLQGNQSEGSWCTLHKGILWCPVLSHESLWPLLGAVSWHSGVTFYFPLDFDKNKPDTESGVREPGESHHKGEEATNSTGLTIRWVCMMQFTMSGQLTEQGKILIFCTHSGATWCWRKSSFPTDGLKVGLQPCHNPQTAAAWAGRAERETCKGLKLQLNKSQRPCN